MKALVYNGPHDVQVEDVPDPKIEQDTDIILRVTSTAICGSDLHLFRGKVPGMEKGDVLGHEFMGIVEETGSGVTKLRKGDRVVVPFTISCGSCFFCSKDLHAFCETTNRSSKASKGEGVRPGAGMFGYTHQYGGYDGGQAQFVRVPQANVGPIKVPAEIPDETVLFLSDILPTGYQAAVNAGVERGSTIAIFGAGPVGFMVAACARLLGAERIFMVDNSPYRLAFATETYGVEPINFDEASEPEKVILERTHHRGVDASIDAVGFEAEGSAVETAMAALKIQGSSGSALRPAMACTRRGGTVSIPGVYAGALHAFMLGEAFEKGLTFKMGQTHVQALAPKLLEHVRNGDLKPGVIISHRMGLSEAARAYDIFDKQRDACRKVVLDPNA